MIDANIAGVSSILNSLFKPGKLCGRVITARSLHQIDDSILRDTLMRAVKEAGAVEGRPFTLFGIPSLLVFTKRVVLAPTQGGDIRTEL